MSSLPTIGGVVTRSEVYVKLLDHIRECQSLTATMAHLHQTENTSIDTTLAHGWLGMSELFKRIAEQTTALAMNKMQ